MEGESCAADSSSKAPAMRRKRSKDKREAAEVREEQKLASTARIGPPAPYEVSLGEAPYEPHQQQQAPPQLQHPLPSPPRYRGIRMRKWGKWVAEIREPNKRSRIWLGSYSTAVAAARAYDTAVYYLRGRSARVNFPEELARELEGASSAAAGLSAAAIRKKAIEVGTRVDAAESGLQAPLAQQQQHEEEENMEEMEDSSSPRYQLPSPVTPTALGQTSGTRKQGKGKGPAGAAPHKAAKKPDLNQQPSDDDDEDGDDGNYD